jgi:hypothetical protein
VADNGRLFIPNLLCRNVSSVAVEGPETTYTRRGLAFESPSQSQLDQLAHLIEKFSVPHGGASSPAEAQAPPLQMSA